MLRHFNEPTWRDVPKGVSQREFLLASLLAPEKATAWPYLSHQYPRSFTEICSDQWRMCRNAYTQWRNKQHIHLTRLFYVLKRVGLGLLISLGLILAITAITRADETTPLKTEADPCQVDWRALPDPIETETDYTAGLHTNHFDVTGDGKIDLSVVFQITYSGQDDLVYNLNNIPLFIRVGKLLGVIDEHHTSRKIQCRVYSVDGESPPHH